VALLPVADALAQVLEGVAPLPAERVALAEAEGRVLAEDLAARRTQPPEDVSAMDGYAVRADDVASAPARLKLIGEVAAGRPFAGEISAGEAARIFTGGVGPRGRDTVVIQEKTPRARPTSSSSPRRPGADAMCASPGSISAKATCG
jgi:molybdopterin molybdotransferase